MKKCDILQVQADHHRTVVIIRNERDHGLAEQLLECIAQHADLADVEHLLRRRLNIIAYNPKLDFIVQFAGFGLVGFDDVVLPFHHDWLSISGAQIDRFGLLCELDPRLVRAHVRAVVEQVGTNIGRAHGLVKHVDAYLYLVQLS